MTISEKKPSERIPTVLIIDDDPTSVVVLESMLAKEGIRPITASGGTEGRALVKSEQPDLVLLDIFMPDESGFETCRMIKEDPHTADIPVIFITSKTDASAKIQGFELGAVDYITKPYMGAEVLARVRVHLRLRFSMQSNLDAQVARLRQLSEAQEAIMPQPGDLPDARFAVAYRPAYEAGGDFYDVLRVGEDVYDYIAADVSGHDLGASLATSALKALLHQGMAAMYSPAETLKMVNKVLRTAFPEELYLTLAYVRLNRRKKRITLMCAGHPDFMLLKKNGELSSFPARGDVLGAFEFIQLDTIEIPVEKGDRFFLYSDGLIEYDGEKPVTRSQGSARLTKMLRDMITLPLEDQVWSVSLTISPEVIHPEDDILLLGVEV